MPQQKQRFVSLLNTLSLRGILILLINSPRWSAQNTNSSVSNLNQESQYQFDVNQINQIEYQTGNLVQYVPVHMEATQTPVYYDSFSSDLFPNILVQIHYLSFLQNLGLMRLPCWRSDREFRSRQIRTRMWYIFDKSKNLVGPAFMHGYETEPLTYALLVYTDEIYINEYSIFVCDVMDQGESIHTLAHWFLFPDDGEIVNWQMELGFFSFLFSERQGYDIRRTPAVKQFDDNLFVIIEERLDELFREIPELAINRLYPNEDVSKLEGLNNHGYNNMILHLAVFLNEANSTQLDKIYPNLVSIRFIERLATQVREFETTSIGISSSEATYICENMDFSLEDDLQISKRSTGTFEACSNPVHVVQDPVTFGEYLIPGGGVGGDNDDVKYTSNTIQESVITAKLFHNTPIYLSSVLFESNQNASDQFWASYPDSIQNLLGTESPGQDSEIVREADEERDTASSQQEDEEGDLYKDKVFAQPPHIPAAISDSLDDLLNYLGTHHNFTGPGNSREILKTLKYLLFYREEIVLLISLAILVAFVELYLTCVIYLSIQEPIKVVEKFVERIKNSPLRSLAPMCWCFTVVWSLNHRFIRSLRRKSSSSKILRHARSMAIKFEHLRTNTLNIFRQEQMMAEIEELRTFMQKWEVLVDLTKFRLAEAAERQQLAHWMKHLGYSDYENYDDEELGFTPCEKFNNLNVPCEFIPFLRLPEHFDEAALLLHPAYWKRLKMKPSEFPAPLYPLQLVEER